MRSDGGFFYTLDDPYIHLSVAESILEGGYGINAGEYASPSSSILYPYLLAATLMLGLGEYGPLLIGCLFSLLSVWTLARFAAQTLPDDNSLVSWLSYIVMGFAIVFALNAIALPMNGMEHSLHVYGVVLALTGLYHCLVKDDDSQIWKIILGSMICGVIRFEGLALVTGVIVALALSGRLRIAIGLGACVASMLALYGFYMSNIGLPFFPSSVMTKSNIAVDASEGSVFVFVKDMAFNFLFALSNSRGVVMGIFSAVLMALCLDATVSARLRMFFVAVLAVLVGHMLAGQFGWFDRYEIYAVAAMFVALLAILKEQNSLRTSYVLAFAMAAMVFSLPYAWTTARSPAASANIYQQQYQMHRFAQEIYPAAVAVNDLGWVAYKNQNYVLDLWGLGSEEARKYRALGGWSKSSLSEITQRNAIEYAMIYDDWFDQVPDDWCLGAQLMTSWVSAGSDTVSFYLIDRTKTDVFFRSLAELAATLPAGARLETKECDLA